MFVTEICSFVITLNGVKLKHVQVKFWSAVYFRDLVKRIYHDCVCMYENCTM